MQNSSSHYTEKTFKKIEKNLQNEQTGPPSAKQELRRPSEHLTQYKKTILVYPPVTFRRFLESHRYYKRDCHRDSANRNSIQIFYANVEVKQVIHHRAG